MTSAAGDSSESRSPFRYVDRPYVYQPEGAEAYEVRIPSRVTNKQMLMRQYVRDLKFPKYFGWNWDALDECLRDLSWLTEAKPIVVVHNDLPFRSGEDRRKIYLQILRDQILARADAALPPFEVVFGTAVRDEVEELLKHG